MLIALRELRRRPGRFVTATAVLTLLVILLSFIGGLLDGLFLGSTGTLRAQKVDAIVYSDSAKQSPLRSRVSEATRARIESVPGVTETGGLSLLLGTGVTEENVASTDDADVADVAVVGYELAAQGVPAPPDDGEAYADRRLEDVGVRPGVTLLIGRTQAPVRIIGMVEDTSFLLQGGVWVNAETWTRVVDGNRPDLVLEPGTFQAVTVRGTGNIGALTKAIDTATGNTETLTKDDAVFALPGIKEQRSTFLQIIFTTLFVAVIVVGLFFSLLTLERTGLYGVLKAMGSSSPQLFAGVVLQAVLVSAAALGIGGLLTFLLTRPIPPAVPVQLTVGRAVFIAVGVLVASVVGSAVSLRRVVRIDPASAIGSSV